MSAMRDALSMAAALIAGWAIGLTAWQPLRVPFSNPLGVVGPLTEIGFNPLNNLLRFALLVTLPALLYAALRVRRGRRTPTPRVDAGVAFSGRTAAALCLLVAMAWLTLDLARALSAPFTPSPLDFFHSGEWLTPAWNFTAGRGLWGGSYFLHGVFYDPLSTALGWFVTGQRTIGAGLITKDALTLLVPPSLAVCLVALALCCPPGGRRATAWAVVVLLALLLTTLATAESLQRITRRDVPVLLGLGGFLFGVAYRSRAALFGAGLCSSLTYFYVIDRGAYFNAALAVTLAVGWWLDRAAARRELRWCLAGAASGWVAFILAVGAAEFRAFLDTTLSIYRTKDLFDSYVYPSPAEGPGVLKVAPLLCISAQLVLAVRALARGGARPALLAQVFVACLAFMYFRSALGRSDPPHVKYASSFAYIGLVFALCALLGPSLATRTRQVRGLAVVMAAGLAALVWSIYWPSIDARAVATAPARLAALIAAPDDAYLSPTERRVRDRWRELSRDDACAFTFTSEAAWVFLLRKPSCGRHSIVWFASAAPLQDEVIRDLDTYQPSHILLRSPGWPNAIDGIDNARRLPALSAAIARSYTPVEHIDGFILARRTAGAPTPR